DRDHGVVADGDAAGRRGAAAPHALARGTLGGGVDAEDRDAPPILEADDDGVAGPQLPLEGDDLVEPGAGGVLDARRGGGALDGHAVRGGLRGAGVEDVAGERGRAAEAGEAARRERALER